MTRNHIVLLTRWCAVVVLTAVALAVATQVALAASAEVNVRIEGQKATLFEGPVTTDGQVLPGSVSEDGQSHKCDGANATPPKPPGPTPATALQAATMIGGFSWSGQWFDGFKDYLVKRIGPDVNFGDFPQATSWIVWVNNVSDYPAVEGGCSTRVFAGDKVVWAFSGPGQSSMLELVPSANKVSTGEPLTVTVKSFNGSGTGSPAQGASVKVAGNTVTADAGGKASVTFGQAGYFTLKAEKTGSVRSNGLAICVYEPGSGACDTPRAPSPVSTQSQVQVDKTAAKGQILWPNRNRYRRSGPKLLRGVAPADPSGIAAVKIKLLQRSGGKGACRGYNFRHERFTARCGKAGFKKIASGAANADLPWSYQLRKRLPPGRYELDLKVKDGAGNVDTLEYQRSRRVFRVVGHR